MEATKVLFVFLLKIISVKIDVFVLLSYITFFVQAENMIAHKEEIYSRPKKTWFTTEKEKKLLAKVAKLSFYFSMGISKWHLFVDHYIY